MFAPLKRAPLAHDPNRLIGPGQRLAWYRADQLVTESSSRVSAWGNIWGNGDLAQGSAGNQPLLEAASIGGKPAIASDDALRWMQGTLTTGLASGQRGYIWQLVRPDVYVTGKAYGCLTAAAGASPRVRLLTTTGTAWQGNVNGSVATSALATGTAVLFELGWTFSGSGLVVKSGVELNDGNPALPNSTISLVSIFSGGTGGTTLSPTGAVAEMIISSAVPDYRRKVAMRNYFRTRYGLI